MRNQSCYVFSITVVSLKVCRFNFRLVNSLVFLLTALKPPISTNPPAVLSSVKLREVLMFFTAMTWSTSCSITTLWWRLWLRTSQPTWRPWGSCLKVLWSDQIWSSILVVAVELCTTCCVTQRVSFSEEQAEFDPQTVRPGSRYSHVQEVQERLNFLRYITLGIA